MAIPLQIAFENLEPSASIEARVEREAAKLERFAHRINMCHVTVIGRSRAHRHGGLFRVRIRVTGPGDTDIVAARNPDLDHAHEDVQVAIRDAFNALRRRLQDRGRRLAGDVKHHEAPPHGRIARLLHDDGYGFIRSSDGHDVYFHRNAVVDGDFDRLKEGAEVRFVETEGDRGPQASTVHPLGKSHIVDTP